VEVPRLYCDEKNPNFPFSHSFPEIQGQWQRNLLYTFKQFSKHEKEKSGRIMSKRLAWGLPLQTVCSNDA